MSLYLFRKVIRKLPAVVVKAVPKPAPCGFTDERDSKTYAADKFILLLKNYSRLAALRAAVIREIIELLSEIQRGKNTDAIHKG